MRTAVFLAAMLGVSFDSSVAQPPIDDVIRVRLDVAPGPYLVGQGIELRVALAERDQRPKLELPALKDARIWIVDTSFKPISASVVGRSIMGENLFLTRLRLVARVAGRLDVPPVVVKLDGREGKSKALRLTIENPPITGRTSNFLGGVGGFTAEAEADRARVRVGQEFVYRIRVKGPAAWGMTIHPDLERLRALPIAARVEPFADETVDEPPERAFVFRVRPTKPGEVVLPPVSIASFDPKSKRYMTRVTGSVPITVVAVSEFDGSTISYQRPAEGPARRVAVATAWLAGLTVAGATVFLLARRFRRRWIEAARTGPTAARRFALATAASRIATTEESNAETARRVLDALVEYARLSVSRPPGALTPDEARAAIALASGSDELGQSAARLAARCDRFVFAADSGESASLSRDARDLFTTLGRSGRGGLRKGKSLQAVSGSRDATTV